MSRATKLLREAAEALNDGRDPLTPPFLDEHRVTLDECYGLGDNLASGALLWAWMLDNPQKALTALRGPLDELKLRALIVALGGTPEG